MGAPEERDPRFYDVITMCPDGYQPVKTDELHFEEIMKFTVDSHYSDFIFRGTGDSKFELVPSLYHERKVDGRVLTGKEIVKSEAEEYISKQRTFGLEKGKEQDLEFYEIASLLWFYDKANKQCIPLPEIPRTIMKNEFLDVQIQRNNLTAGSYIQRWSGIAAVAQHYGIPTRMLDWTFDVNVALYFAVKNLPLEGSTDHPEFVSLWILDKSKISIICDRICFVMPKYSDNPNIGAQSGLFSILTGEDPGERLDDVVAKAHRDMEPGLHSVLDRDGMPILAKINIPYEDARKIKKNFEDHDISYDSIFPGLSGVVRSMEIQSGIRKA